MIGYIENKIVKNNPIKITSTACCSGLRLDLLRHLDPNSNIPKNSTLFLTIEWALSLPDISWFSNIDKDTNIIFSTEHKIDIINVGTFLLNLVNSNYISSKNIYLMIGYESQVKELELFLSTHGVFDISVISNMTWLLWAGDRLDLCNLDINVKPNKVFSVFSRRYSEDRRNFLLDLLINHILEASHFTFSNGHPDFPTFVSLDNMMTNLPSYMYNYENQIREWLSKVPYSVEYDVPASSDIYKLSLDSYINVVLETHVEHNINGVLLTEKIFKPIVVKKPFIVYGQHNILQSLREQGFRTFDGIINESYDLIVDSNKRRLAIVQELVRINQLFDNKFHELVEQCKEICEYNYNVYLNYKNRTMPESFLKLNLFGTK